MIANSLDTIKLLVESGVDVNAFNANGQTLVHAAAGRGANAIIQYAFEKGARLDKKDKQGRTPLDIASGSGGGGGRGGAAGAGARGGGGGRGNESTAALLRELMAKSAR